MKDNNKRDFFLNNVVVHYQHVHNYILAITKDAFISEDLTQSSMERAWQCINQLRDKKMAKSWLFTIARNQVNQYYRNNKRDLGFEDTSDEISMETIGASERHILDALIHKEEISDLLKALEMLSSRYKPIIHLRYLGEFTFKDIALMLNMKDSTARVYAQRGLAELESIFKKIQKGNFE